MAKMLLADGSSYDLHPESGETFALKEMQKIVAGGGNIEIMFMSDETVLVFDEEGRLKNLPYNLNATRVVMDNADIDSYDPPDTWSHDLAAPRTYLVGDCLVCSKNEIE